VCVSICVSSPNPKPNENRVLFSGPPVGPCALEINKLPVHYQSNTGNSCFSFAIAIWHTNTEGPETHTHTQIQHRSGEKRDHKLQQRQQRQQQQQPPTTSLSEFEVLKILIEQTCFDGNALYFIYHSPSVWDWDWDSDRE